MARALHLGVDIAVEDVVHRAAGAAHDGGADREQHRHVQVEHPVSGQG
jgi:hypothetical protein